MNTYTLILSSTTSTQQVSAGTVDLFNATEVTLQLKDVYSDVFPNYIGIDWGDGSAIYEPDIKIYRDYRTDSIYPEIENGASPAFLNQNYTHVYYPSDYALKKVLTFRAIVGYINGNTAAFSVPINVRSEGYYQIVDDLEIKNIDLLDDDENNNRYTFLTKKDNFIVQLYSSD
jgi:hypothetical protein